MATTRKSAKLMTRPFTRSIVIDCDVDYADFSIAAHQDNIRLDATLRCLSVPYADLGRIERKSCSFVDRAGYLLGAGLREVSSPAPLE
jgi:hypothetical protein